VIRVFIVAPSPPVRAGLQNLLANRATKVVGTAASVESLEGELAEAEPDVVLVDASGERDGQVIETFSDSGLASEVPMVLLADQTFAAKSAAALRAGIRGVLPSEVTAEQLLAALEAVVAGLVVMHPTEVTAAFPALATPAWQPPAELLEPLTRRERQVLEMLASGLGNKEIAARLNISDHTAKFHVASILGKLGAGSRTEAVAIGMRRGFLLL
jgi:two-component system, NarL family, response regulator YdfI